MQQANLGLIGGGTVGSGVYHALTRNAALLTSRIGVGLGVRKVAVKAFDEPRPYSIPRRLMTTTWQEVVNDPEVHVVAELVGGTSVARTMILEALKLGKPVITANKALLSKHGEELFATAQRHKTNLYYEASVCGGIPIIKSLREGFVGNQITHLYGIVNGTCNYILTRMSREGAEFDAVLKEAQALGYAEAEPSLDIDGFDAQHKTGILASLAHGFWVDPKDIYVEGIRSVTRQDMEFAAKLGYTIKLLGMVKMTAQAPANRKSDRRQVQVSVYPALIPSSHVLASVGDVFNAVFVRGDVVGDTLFYGRGAGKDATASAVLSDFADAVLDLKCGSVNRVPAFVSHEVNGSVVPIDKVVSRYFVRLRVADIPGTLARITRILGDARIGISSVIQPEGQRETFVPLILMLHESPYGAVCAAFEKIRALQVVKGKPVILRVETFG
jgi:homoserine dehydrogenase